MPFLDSTMSNSIILHPMQTPPWCCWSPSLTSRQTHQARGYPVACSGMITSPGLHFSMRVPTLIAQPPTMYLYGHHWYRLSIHLQVTECPPFQPCFCPSAGAWPLTQLCLSAHSNVLQGIQTVYIQGLQACSTYVPPFLLLLWPPACTHGSRDTLVLC